MDSHIDNKENNENKESKVSEIENETEINLDISKNINEYIELQKVDFNEIKKAIKLLSENHQIEIKNLAEGSKLQQSYQMIKFTVNLLRKTDQYTMIPDIIRMQYRPTVITPGTIGTFLFGCFQNCYGDVFKICSPLCIDNIPSEKYYNTECKHQIWVILDKDNTYNKNIKYGLINSNGSNHAYIYVDKDFSYFNEDEIEIFKKEGMEYAQILITEKSKHHILIKMTPIDKLPIKSNNELDNDLDNSLNNKNNINEIIIKDSKSIHKKRREYKDFILNNISYVIIIIIFLIIFIFVFIIFKHK